MRKCLTLITVLLPLAGGCVRVFPGSDGREATDGGNISSSQFGYGSRPSSSRVVDGGEFFSSAHAPRGDSGTPRAADGGRISSSGNTTIVDAADAAHTAGGSVPAETSVDNTTTAVDQNTESDDSTTGLLPVEQPLSVCWAETGFEQEKTWIIEVLESTIEQTALLDFTGWGPCADEAASDIVVHLTQSAVSSPTTQAPPNTSVDDAGQATMPAYVSLALSIADAHAVDAAMGEEDGCDPASASEDGPFVDVIGRTWSSERHYCVAGKALARFMAMLLPDQPSFGCSTVGSTPLNPDFGYHDATSIFSDCPPVGAYLSQLDRTLLARERGARPGALIWFGLGSLGSLQDPSRPVNEDRLFTDVLPVPAESTRTPAIGDFNGDGFDDIFMYGKGNLPDEIIFGAAAFRWAPVETTMGGNYTPITGDFNGDGFDDILWYSATDEQSLIRYGGSSAPFSNETPLDIERGQQLVAGDFDGDGRADVLVQTVGDDDYFLFGNSNGTFDKYAREIRGIFAPFVGDFDQDGFDDIFLYREGRDVDYFWWGNANRSILQSTDSASGTYNPTVGDFDGNGADDILWGNALTEAEPLWLFTLDRSVTVKIHVSSILERETPGDARIPFAGDLDGNGISDVLWL